MQGETRNSRRLLVQARNGGLGCTSSVNARDRRIGFSAIAIALAEQSFAPDAEILVEDEIEEELQDLIDDHRHDLSPDFPVEYDLLSDPELPGWGTVIQWSDLHFFTGAFVGDDS